MALLPKFSIRHLLLATLAMAVIFTCFAGAARGNAIAFGVATGFVMMLVPVVAFAIAYWALYLFASITSHWRSQRMSGAAHTAESEVSTEKSS